MRCMRPTFQVRDGISRTNHSFAGRQFTGQRGLSRSADSFVRVFPVQGRLRADKAVRGPLVAALAVLCLASSKSAAFPLVIPPTP